MKVAILVEPVRGNGCRASTGAPFALETEAATREEALCNLRELIDDKIRSGAELVTMEVGDSEHPLARFAGTLKDDPLLEEWKQAMADYRREMDEDTSAR